MFRSLRSVLQFRRLELDRVTRQLRTAANVDDLRALARRRLPRGVFDYIDGGAEDETTLRRNVDAFRRIEFRPRVFRDIASVNTGTTLLGHSLPMPLVLAPTGFTRMVDPEGELAVARAADRAHLPYTLSTLSTRSIEEVAGASTGAKWFQVYVWRDRGLVASMLDRAAASGYDAIMITVDTAVLGRRERDVRHGFTLPPKLGLDTIVDGMLHPGWTWAFARSEPISFANVAASAPQSVTGGDDPVNLSEYINSQFDPALSWKDLEWFRSRWPGHILIKGVQTVEDAKVAVAEGVDGVILSNHGGRQLDGAPPPVELVPPVVDAIGEAVPVICDGGVRRGADIAKAMALGASACMIGRAYLYGLGAAGERGVDHVIEFLANGLRQTLTLCGVADVADLTADHVRWREG
jgi:L-lactate dehydrogenase (cytochrome)